MIKLFCAKYYLNILLRVFIVLVISCILWRRSFGSLQCACIPCTATVVHNKKKIASLL